MALTFFVPYCFWKNEHQGMGSLTNERQDSYFRILLIPASFLTDHSSNRLI